VGVAFVSIARRRPPSADRRAPLAERPSYGYYK
jgi:hypothetical protein